MGLIGSAARAYLFHRMAGGGRRRGRRGYGSAYGRRGRRSRPESGFGFFGPLPSYSRRTRRGSRVRVSGCCLPIPLAMTVGTATLARAAVRRR